MAFESASKDLLLEEPVEIVTAYATGPRPVAYTPLGYESIHPARVAGDHPMVANAIGF